MQLFNSLSDKEGLLLCKLEGPSQGPSYKSTPCRSTNLCNDPKLITLFLLYIMTLTLSYSEYRILNSHFEHKPAWSRWTWTLLAKILLRGISRSAIIMQDNEPTTDALSYRLLVIELGYESPICWNQNGGCKFCFHSSRYHSNSLR